MKNISRRNSCAFLIIATVFLSMSAAHADETGDLARASQNPISSLISVPFEFNNNFNTGPEDAYFQQLLIKPVIPMRHSSFSIITEKLH